MREDVYMLLRTNDKNERNTACYIRTQDFFMLTATTLIRLGGKIGDLSLCWAHRSFCWFYHAAAHMYVIHVMSVSITLSGKLKTFMVT